MALIKKCFFILCVLHSSSLVASGLEVNTSTNISAPEDSWELSSLPRELAEVYAKIQCLPEYNTYYSSRTFETYLFLGLTLALVSKLNGRDIFKSVLYGLNFAALENLRDSFVSFFSNLFWCHEFFLFPDIETEKHNFTKPSHLINRFFTSDNYSNERFSFVTSYGTLVSLIAGFYAVIPLWEGAGFLNSLYGSVQVTAAFSLPSTFVAYLLSTGDSSNIETDDWCALHILRGVTAWGIFNRFTEM